MRFDDGLTPDHPDDEPPFEEPAPPSEEGLWRTTPAGLIIGLGLLTVTALLLGSFYSTDSEDTAVPSPSPTATPQPTSSPSPPPSPSPTPPQASPAPPPAPTTQAPPPPPTTNAPAPPPVDPVVNGGFETGNLNGWTSTGTTSVITTAPRSGTYTAQTGETVPTNGDSAISQTFTATAGSSTLSFWYQVICTGSIDGDWVTATLKNNTTGNTENVLPRTCTNGEGWKQAATTTITPGNSYTLTLTSHDDNTPGLPTLALFDDIVLG